MQTTAIDRLYSSTHLERALQTNYRQSERSELSSCNNWQKFLSDERNFAADFGPECMHVFWYSHTGRIVQKILNKLDVQVLQFRRIFCRRRFLIRCLFLTKRGEVCCSAIYKQILILFGRNTRNLIKILI